MDFGDLSRKHHALVSKDFCFECGPGWIGILDDLLTKLANVIPVESDFILKQVKEKLGGLRFYFRIDPEPSSEVYCEINWHIDVAEARSFHVCERCGRPGRLMKRRGFFFTACEACCSRDGDDGRRALPVPREPHYVRFSGEAQWYVFDPDRVDLVPTDPPGGFEGR